MPVIPDLIRNPLIIVRGMLNQVQHDAVRMTHDAGRWRHDAGGMTHNTTLFRLL
jgi:hypothetical protein